jgi:aspartyl-tRNA(Asn)/glutamyl-tRNA(Gln) amidotransferase subunit B
MEQGSLRCDVNVSVRKKGDLNLGTKVEVKNLNSIRFIKKAIESESMRLIGMHQRSEAILQQTRGLNESDFTTYAIRTKEDEDDYRYFPEPDLPPFFITDEMIEAIRKEMPKPVTAIKEEIKTAYSLQEYDASQLANDNELLSYFENIIKETKNYKAAANWTIGPVKNYLTTEELSIDEFKVPPAAVATLIKLIDAGTINFGIASQKIFPELMQHPALDIVSYIKENSLELETSGSQIDLLIQTALNKHAQKITEYKKGKKGLLSLFVGEVMKLSGGKVDAKIVTDKIIEKLNA